MSGKSVFISYSSRDRESAIKIRRLLESDQVRVWLDVIDIRMTNQLQQELFDSIDKQDIFCLLLSPSSVESQWVLREIEYAKTKEGLQILPIILRSCSIPDSLGDMVGLDAREGFDSETVRLRLLRAIHGKEFVENSVLLGKAERELLAKAQILERAEKELPQIAKTIDPLSSDPIRQIELQIDVASLPEDDDIILELSLTLDLFDTARVTRGPPNFVSKNPNIPTTTSRIPIESTFNFGGMIACKSCVNTSPTLTPSLLLSL